jgi:dCMP deaminase
MVTQAEWDQRWLDLATDVASWSRDFSTIVGCVIVGTANQVLSTGYNGFPRGVNDDITERYERPAKYQWTEHGERNAIYNAARTGVALEGASLYVTATPSLYPCADCARGIIQSGIVTVVCDAPDWDHPRWSEAFIVTSMMLSEAGIEVRSY